MQKGWPTMGQNAKTIPRTLLKLAWVLNNTIKVKPEFLNNTTKAKRWVWVNNWTNNDQNNEPTNGQNNMGNLMSFDFIYF